MKTVKVILGLIIALFSTTTIFEMYKEESGAGLNGAITGYIIIMLIAIWLIYTGSRDKTIDSNKPSLDKNIKSEKVDNNNKFDTAISNLEDLKESGILTEEEYKTKIQKIEIQKTEFDLLKSNEYKQLKYLLDSNILTKDEFEAKIEILKSKKSDENIIIANNDYRIVDGYSEGLALAIDDNLDYGYINTDGKVVIDFIFEHAENFQNGRAKVRINGQFKSIDYNGNTM